MKKALKILVVSLIIGVVAGFAIDIFIRILQESTKFVWNDLVPQAKEKPTAVIIISVIGGVLMGLCVKYFGTNDGVGFEAVLQSVKIDGELGVKQLKRVVVNSFAGLVTGASIGPENPITVMGGYVGNAIGKKLKLAKDQLMAMILIAVGGSLGIILNTPVAGPVLLVESHPAKDDQSNTLLVFASMAAASIGFAVYLLLKGPLLISDKIVPTYGGFKPMHLVYGLLIGIIGTVVGLVLKYAIHAFQKLFKVFGKQFVVRGAVVGLIIGLCGAMLPLTLFDGSAQLQQVLGQVTTYSIGALLILAVVRLFTTAVALSGGYQGGNIFPTIFICGVIGLAINMAIPAIPAPVAMIACMVPAMFVFVPLPLFTIFLFTELSSFSLIPVMAFALLSAYIIQLARAEKTRSSKPGQLSQQTQ